MNNDNEYQYTGGDKRFINLISSAFPIQYNNALCGVGCIITLNLGDSTSGEASSYATLYQAHGVRQVNGIDTQYFHTALTHTYTKAESCRCNYIIICD